VSLVHHDDRVAGQERVHKSLSDEESICEELDAGGGGGDIFKADRIPNFFTELASNLLCNPDSNCCGSNTPGLRRQVSCLLLCRIFRD
jgi:hypothetical protein